MLCSRCNCNFCCSIWLLNFTCCSKNRELVIIKKSYSHRTPSGGYCKMSITVHYFVMKEKKRKGQIGIANEPLSTVNPLISPPGGIFISSPFEGGLHRDRGAYLIQQRRGYQFSKKNQNTKWKSSSTRCWRSCSRGSKTIPNFQIPCARSFTVLWLISTVYHLLMKNNKVEGRGGEGVY